MKKRYELPVLKKLNVHFNINELRQSYEQFVRGKTWNALGSEYASMCEKYPNLPRCFFKDEELENVDSICNLDWKKASFKQLSLTEFDNNFKLNIEESKNNASPWGQRIALNNPKTDERWFRKIKKDVPEYLRYVLKILGDTHRTRFACLSSYSSIKPHVDYNTDYSIRLHIAIKTNSKCKNGGWDKNGILHEGHIPSDGSVWFVNPGVRHFAVNEGSTDRVHLIISVDSQRLLNKDLNFKEVVNDDYKKEKQIV